MRSLRYFSAPPRVCWRATRAAMLVAAICSVGTGCSRPDYEVAPVSGRVTMGGRGLAGVAVNFQPVSKGPDQPNPGPGSYGTTDADGRFVLRTIEGDAEGAVVGTHRVRLRTKAPAQDPADDRAVTYKEIVPRQWRDGSQTFEVPPEGTDQADFELGSP